MTTRTDVLHGGPKIIASRTTRLHVPYLIIGLVLFELFLATMYLLSVRYSAASSFFADTVRLWDMDGEGNLPAWFSATQLWTVAIVVAAIAWREYNPRRLAWWALVAGSAAFAFLSMDEGAMFHERTATVIDRLFVDRNHSTFVRTGIWMFVLGPVLLAGAGLLAWGAWDYLKSHPAVIALASAGMVIFLGGAVGLEAYSNFVVYVSFEYKVYVALEEFAEMFGITLMLWAACLLADRTGVRIERAGPNAVAR